VSVQIIIGDAMEQLRLLPSDSVHCCVTSPPYYGLRDYGVAGQIGLEPSPDEYVARLVDVFCEVRRVLRADGTVWLNLGDSYCAPGGGFKPDAPSNIAGSKQALTHPHATKAIRSHIKYGCKPKDLLGIPWRVAFALRDDGWYLRQDIIWAKPNPMPESVRDRCCKAHEYLFLLSKSPRYFYDADAIKEPAVSDHTSGNGFVGRQGGSTSYQVMSGGVGSTKEWVDIGGTRNRRSVWTIASEAFPGSHFAVFPPALIEPCILAGTSERGVCAVCGAPWVRVVDRVGEWRAQHDRQAKHNGEVYRTNPGGGVAGINVDRRTVERGWRASCACDAATVPATVLDMFGGAGTTGLVADRLGRNAVLIELNPAYAEMARSRIESDAPLFAEVREPARAAMPIQELLL